MLTEEEIVRSIVNDEKMHCAACNVTLYNESVWEVHKKGKKHLKQLRRAVEERKQHPEMISNAENHSEDADTTSSPKFGLMSLNSNDPVLAFISGMEDVKPQISEKALKKQEKRRAKQRKQDEENKRAAEQQNREREEETSLINKQVIPLGRCVKYVPADGNCMYRSIAEQLAIEDPSLGTSVAYRTIRKLAAETLRKHKEDFVFFLEDNIDYEDYCKKVENSNEWGGQLELRALSMALNRPIRIYSADSPVVIMGEDINNTPLFISYHKKYLSLGNHYNTLIPL